MKHSILLICSFWLSIAFSTPPSLDSLFVKANSLYQQKEYEQAIDHYQSILDADHASFELYYNLANSYFQFGKIPSSILYYEKALNLDRHNKHCLSNLKLAQSRITLIESMPTLFYVRWWNTISSTLSSQSWSILTIIALWILSTLCVLFINKRSRWLFYSLLFFAFISINLFVLMNHSKKMEQDHYGVIMKHSKLFVDSQLSNSVFTVKSGNKALLKDSLNNRVRVFLADGQTGWIEKNHIARIKN